MRTSAKPTPKLSMNVVPPVPGALSRWYIAVGYLATGKWYADRRDFHTGWDFNLLTGGNSDAGETVVSIADGEVIFVGILPVWGGVVVVRHPQLGVRTRYGHVTNFKVKVGDWVKAGQPLAEIALMTRFLAHLHFDITSKELLPAHWCLSGRSCVERNYVDPLVFFVKHGVPFPRQRGGARLSWADDAA